MKTLVNLAFAAGFGLVWLVVWPVRAAHAETRRHEAVEYYGTFDGYGLPLKLSKQITKEEADARAARGEAYIIGYYDAAGRLVRNVKMYRGVVFFEHIYTYYPSGKLQRMQVTNSDGQVTVRDYKETDRPKFTW